MNNDIIRPIDLDISQQLQQTPDWISLNAYQRAKICCQLLTTLGLPIPSWMQLRQWIGKGSANDIHRAKQDFLSDRQHVKSEWIQQDEMPTQLSGSLQEWWQQLKQAAEQDHLALQQRWQHEKTELQTQCGEAQTQLDQQQQVIEQLQQQLETAQQRYQQVAQNLVLQEQLATEVARQQTCDYQKLLQSIHTQQANYFTEQQQQRAQQLADQQQHQVTLDTQLNLLADFHVFAAQQIDLARRQHDQQQTLTIELILELLQQVLSEQAKQQQIRQQSRTPVVQAKRGQRPRKTQLFRF